MLLTPQSSNISPRNKTKFKPKLDIVPPNTTFEGNSDETNSFDVQNKFNQGSNHSQNQTHTHFTSN